MSPRPKFGAKAFAKTVFNGALGIMLEIVLTLSIIIIGLAVSLIWWGVFR